MVIIWSMCMLLCLINIKYNNRHLKYLILILMIMIMSCNNKAIDEIILYTGYKQISAGIYQTYDITSYLFVDVLMGISNKVGLSFGFFNFFTFLPAIMLIDYSLKKLIKNPSIVYLLFVSTSIMLDTTLARQFIAMTFVIYGITFLVSENKSTLKFILFVLIGSFIHFSMFAFLSFALSKLKISRKQLGIIIISISSFLLIFTLIGGQQIPVVSFILKLLNSTKTTYGSSGGVELGYLYVVYIWIAMYLTVYIIKGNCKYIMNKKDFELVSNIVTMVAISSIFIPFSTMTLVYCRLFRPVSWLVFIIIAKWVESRKNFKKINIKILFVSLFFILNYSYIYNRILFSYSVTIEPVEKGTPFWDDDYSKLPWSK